MIKFDNNIISHITSYVIDLTQLKKFHIRTYLKVDLFLIIYHLIYLTFLINFCNQFLQSTLSINLY